MQDILTCFSPTALLAALEANVYGFLALFGYLPEAQVHDAPDIFWSLTNIPFPLFNSVARARLASESVDSVIEAAIARCQASQVPMMWWIGPSTSPKDMAASLLRHGFVYDEASPAMLVNLDELKEQWPLPSGATIARVTDLDMLRKWNHAKTLGFGDSTLGENIWLNLFSRVGAGEQSPCRYYMALQDAQPVATSMLLFAGGVAGVYGVTTMPEMRRQGFGRALTLAALRDARSLGYRVGMLMSSEMGESLYRKLGFQEYCQIETYIWGE